MTSGYEKILSEYVKKGWKLTDLECPVCRSPLLEKNNEYFCAVCNRKVRIAESLEEYVDLMEEHVLNELRYKIINQLRVYSQSSDLNEEMLRNIDMYLSILRMLKELKK